ncbi:unnamed protein product [Callosobruchus maculatus]|uniref:IGFBP N-terminal domain-containing protein n=1 Tax=Callosobruchus maculatus TaxID=64391 RepID=A0A653D9F8_CALMS|nr:unnamed protein product [Callosobruchus maculatus]
MKTLVILVLLFSLYVYTLCEKRCPSTICDDIKVKCQAVECSEGFVEIIVPELCRCCPYCYKLINGGGNCSNPWETVCANGYKCNIKGVCESSCTLRHH